MSTLMKQMTRKVEFDEKDASGKDASGKDASGKLMNPSHPSPSSANLNPSTGRDIT
jgi:hypothetical protein